MADERIVDVGAMLSKWHDLLGSAYPNLPCQTFPMFIRNNSQELVRCRECKESEPLSVLDTDCLYCGVWDTAVHCNGYCSHGAKMGGGSDDA